MEERERGALSSFSSSSLVCDDGACMTMVGNDNEGIIYADDLIFVRGRHISTLGFTAPGQSIATVTCKGSVSRNANLILGQIQVGPTGYYTGN